MSTIGQQPDKGSRLGRYTLTGRIGAGGMATVFRATDPHGDAYAIKVLNLGAMLGEDAKRFQREFRTLERMDHPNIVRVYEAGVTDGHPWIAMELVEGMDLESLIEQWRLTRDTSDAAARFAHIQHILKRLCSALQYVHDRKLIHRDIKPSNVLMTSDGEPKLSDFGVVKGRADNTSHITQLTMAGRLVGTVAFMAPELITSDDDVDQRADLYSLGAMLYLMLTFKRPIEADTVAGYLARHLTEVPRTPSEIDPDIPRPIERVTNRLLLKDRSYRYASASAVLAALDRDLDDEPPPVRGRDRQLQGWSRRMEALMDGAGGAVIVYGPSGSGKTHLLQAMADQAKTGRARVLCAIDWKHDPMFPLADAAGLDPDGSLGGAVSRAIAVSLSTPDEQGKVPAVIVVDRMDEAPPRTIQALSALLRERCSLEGQPLLLLIGATSLDAVVDLVNGHSTGMPADLIATGPVNLRATTAMLRDRGVPSSVLAPLAQRLHTEYAGSPGAMVQQLEMLVDQGWFTSAGPRQLELAVPATTLRTEELPVPTPLAEAVIARLTDLDLSQRQAVELLAILDRPAGPSLLGRCTGSVHDAARTLESLVAAGLLRPAEDETGETYQAVHPSTMRVIRQHLSPEVRRGHHEAIAKALYSRRRRGAGLEVARHLHLAGQLAKAYPLYVSAARREARSGPAVTVLDICAQALGIRAEAEALLPEDEVGPLRRQLFQLQGDASFSEGDYILARSAFKEAVAAAREESDPIALARCVGGLGRSLYRLGLRERALPLLEEALSNLEPRDAERGPLLRDVAQLCLTGGDIARADQLLSDALASSITPEAEARAKRGLAQVRIFQGNLIEANELYQDADDLLSLQDAPDLRTSVLASSIEIHALIGQWGTAVRRAETLVDLARRRELGSRLPDAYSLLAQILGAVGAREEALDAALQAKVFLSGHPERIAARLRVVRALIDVGRLQDAAEMLPARSDLDETESYNDWPANHAALRARVVALQDPARAQNLAVWAVSRPPGALPYRAAFTALDASLALVAAGHNDTARTAAKRGLRCIKGLGADGLRLQLLVSLHKANPDPRVLGAIQPVAARILSRLPTAMQQRFLARDVVGDALELEPTRLA